MVAFLKAFAEEGKKGLMPQKVGKLVREILEHSNPKPRYMITPTPFTDKVLLRFMPTRLLDSMLGKTFKLNRLKKAAAKKESVPVS